METEKERNKDTVKQRKKRNDTRMKHRKCGAREDSKR